MRNIRETPRGFEVKIRLFGRLRSFGAFPTLPEAVAVRNNILAKYSYGLTLEPKRQGYGVKGNRACFTLKGVKYDLGEFATPNLAAHAVNQVFIRAGKEPPNEVDQLAVDNYRANHSVKIANAVREARMKIRKAKGPEWYLQQDIIKYLKVRGWKVKVMTAHKHLWGMPDLLASHKKYGPRYIEVKNPKKYSFTSAQMKDFPEWITHGLPIYVLTGADAENYQRLFNKSNLWIYMAGYSDGK